MTLSKYPLPVKLKWRVGPKPTGKWAAFQPRGWPQCEDDRGNIVAFITCNDDYRPSLAKSGMHAELTVKLYVYRDGVRKTATMMQRPKTLAEAKEQVTAFYRVNPDFLDGFPA